MDGWLASNLAGWLSVPLVHIHNNMLDGWMARWRTEWLVGWLVGSLTR